MSETPKPVPIVVHAGDGVTETVVPVYICATIVILCIVWMTTYMFLRERRLLRGWGVWVVFYTLIMCLWVLKEVVVYAQPDLCRTRGFFIVQNVPQQLWAAFVAWAHVFTVPQWKDRVFYIAMIMAPLNFLGTDWDRSYTTYCILGPKEDGIDYVVVTHQFTVLIYIHDRIWQASQNRRGSLYNAWIATGHWYAAIRAFVIVRVAQEIIQTLVIYQILPMWVVPYILPFATCGLVLFIYVHTMFSVWYKGVKLPNYGAHEDELATIVSRDGEQGDGQNGRDSIIEL